MADRPVVLISGASRGLGYALAVEAASRGAHVLALARTQSALDELADEIEASENGAITVVPGDINDDDAMRYMAQSIFQRFERLDYWFHTALFTAPMQPAAHLFGKDIDEALNTNIRATARLINSLDPMLRNTDGARAVFLDEADIADANMANLAVSKSGQINLAKQWQSEAAKIGPKVEILTPPAMQGHHRSTLYPGQDKHALPTPKSVAAQILDQIGL